MIGPPWIPLTAAPSGTWPGIDYPWMPWSPWTDSPGLPADGRICLGSQCWWLSRLSITDADEMARVLRRKSFPLAQASLAAVALYQKGFEEQARGVLRMYGGIYGMERVAQQIRRVYDGGCGPQARPRMQ